jgi:hypothetical protein
MGADKAAKQRKSKRFLPLAAALAVAALVSGGFIYQDFATKHEAVAAATQRLSEYIRLASLSKADYKRMVRASKSPERKDAYLYTMNSRLEKIYAQPAFQAKVNDLAPALDWVLKQNNFGPYFFVSGASFKVDQVIYAEASGDSATLILRGHNNYRNEKGGVRPSASGTYHLKLTKVQGVWLISRERVTDYNPS